VKLCTNCNTNKELTEFYTNKTKYHCYCKECTKAKNTEWKLRNKEKVTAYDKAWQQNNKDKKAKNYKNWQVNNRAKVNSYNSYRRALELQATPSWLTEEQLNQIESFYWLSKVQYELTDTKYHVDHIVPLKGKTVCGLHVPWNLQVIPALENICKGNKIAIS
jgi:hypothetical protein